MDLPLKIFYALEELAGCRWLGFSSVDELLHLAAIGKLTLCVSIEGGKFYYSPDINSLRDEIVDHVANGNGKFDYPAWVSGEASPDFKESYHPLAVVPAYVLASWVFTREKETSTMLLWNMDEKEFFRPLFKLPNQESKLPVPIKLKVDDLLVTHEEAMRFAEQLRKDNISEREPGTDNRHLREGEVYLNGSKEIMKYAGCSRSSMYRNYKKALRKDKSGGIFTTNFMIDEIRFHEKKRARK